MTAQVFVVFMFLALRSMNLKKNEDSLWKTKISTGATSIARTTRIIMTYMAHISRPHISTN
jgi:hypothetical protein